jgi:hypothetical protein
VWEKSGASQQDHTTDSYQCEKDTRQSQYFGGGLVGALEMADFAKKCMAAKGWRQVTASSAVPSPRAVQLKEAAERYSPCVMEIRNRSVFETIQSRFSDPANGKFSPAQLSDPRHPTPLERQLYIAYFNEIRQCRDKFLVSVSVVSPEFALIMETLQAEQQEVALILSRGSIAWGEGSVRMQLARDKAASKIKAIAL